MKRRIARHKRTLALLLTLCLLFTCLPLQAMSAGGTAEETDISNEVYIVDEDITKRGEYEKHFLCSDGTYRAVSYAEPVHYYDSSTGTWQDNDVALTLNAASTRYEAQSGSFAVSFAKSYAAPALSATGTMGEEASNALTTSGSIAQNAAASQTVTMSNGIYPISWTTAVKPEFSVAEGTAVQAAHPHACRFDPDVGGSRSGRAAALHRQTHIRQRLLRSRQPYQRSRIRQHCAGGRTEHRGFAALFDLAA